MSLCCSTLQRCNFNTTRSASWRTIPLNLSPRPHAKRRADGWPIDVPRTFRHAMLEVDAWEADFHDDGNGWLSLNLGVVLEGQRLPLAPLLYDLFQHDARWLDAAKAKQIRDAEMIKLQ